MSTKKLVVLTSGGDSPSMNAAIYSFVVSANQKGYSVFGVIDGYRGLYDSNFKEIDAREFKPNIFNAGTAIGSSRFLAFKDDPAVRAKCADNLKKAGFDALFVIGGDGSYMGAGLLSQLGVPVIAAPGTIDNDVASSRFTIGFFSALEEIYQGIKKVKATSESHSQVTFVEVMGRDCHDLTAVAALVGAVDYVVTNKNPKTAEELEVVLKKMIEAGKKGIVILVTERIYGSKFGFDLPELPELCKTLEAKINRQVRFNVLGYLQRGANPVSWDLFVSHKFGQKAFELVESNKINMAIGFDGYDFYTTPILEATKVPKKSYADVIDFVNNLYKI